MKIIDKPWGYENIFAHTKDYVGKILVINPNSKLSLQYHNKKEETIYVIEGVLHLHVGKTEDDLKVLLLPEGYSYHITPKLIHRFEAKHNKVRLAEVSTTELNDVVRIKDDYGRKDS